MNHCHIIFKCATLALLIATVGLTGCQQTSPTARNHNSLFDFSQRPRFFGSGAVQNSLPQLPQVAANGTNGLSNPLGQLPGVGINGLTNPLAGIGGSQSTNQPAASRPLDLCSQVLVSNPPPLHQSPTTRSPPLRLSNISSFRRWPIKSTR